jgi:hypothetical protein
MGLADTAEALEPELDKPPLPDSSTNQLIHASTLAVSADRKRHLKRFGDPTKVGTPFIRKMLDRISNLRDDPVFLRLSEPFQHGLGSDMPPHVS